MLTFLFNAKILVKDVNKMPNHKIKFKLKNLMEEKNLSKNHLCKITGLRFETIQGYYNGNISRVDLYVLSLLCDKLDCKIEDIIEYKDNVKQVQS